MVKKTVKKKPKISNVGDPSKVSAAIERETPIVAEKPKTPQDNDKEDGQPRVRQTKKVVAAQAMMDKQAADKLIAKTIVDMKIALMTKVGGELWEVETAEYEALVMAYQNALGQFPSIPWWLGLALAEGAYVGPRIVIASMNRAKAAREAKALKKPEGAIAPDPAVMAAAQAVGTNDSNKQLDPAG